MKTVRIVCEKQSRIFEMYDEDEHKLMCLRVSASDVLRELESMGDVSIRFIDEMFDKRK